MGTTRLPSGGGETASDRIYLILFEIILISTLIFCMLPLFFSTQFFEKIQEVQILGRHQCHYLSLSRKDPIFISAYDSIFTVCCDVIPLWDPILVYTFKCIKISLQLISSIECLLACLGCTEPEVVSNLNVSYRYGRSIIS
jgi:hypothetical protein